tara:strand:- start:1924 stop:3321 length:1398 start_codon:yes stop_codon:yes gene_type:complete
VIDLSVLKSKYGQRPAVVYGLGVSGLASVVALTRSGFHVIAWDDNAQAREAAAQYGAELVDVAQDFPLNAAFLLLSPGIPLTHPEPHDVVKAAQKNKVEILCDIELLHRATPNIKKIGITGTNGKSTTTALIGHILQESGRSVDIGGNLGIPALALNVLDDNGIYVLEMSSYQLDLCPTFQPDIGVLLNITPDHLDRHGGIEGYAKAKSHIFGKNTIAICAVDDDHCRQIAKTNPATQTITFSTDDRSADIYPNADNLHTPEGDVTLDNYPNLRGEHNLQNIMAAFIACREAGLMTSEIQSGLATFPGLEHRQKRVRHLNGIDFINDSKATNDEAASKALSAYPNNIYWIAGGQAKGSDYPKCRSYFDRIRHAYLIGEGATDLKANLDAKGVASTHSKILHAAVFKAYEDARADLDAGKIDHATILLSPACASWDQFANFEQRGQVFAECVEYLPKRLPTGKEAG